MLKISTSRYIFMMMYYHIISRLGSSLEISHVKYSRSSLVRLFGIEKTQEQETNRIHVDKLKVTGGLKRLPQVQPANEMFSRARKNVLKVKPDSGVKNIRNRKKKEGSEKIDTLMKSLSVPLRDLIKGYRSTLRRLHPFEKVVVNLTISKQKKKDGLTLESILDEMNEARKEILLMGKDYIYSIKSSPSAREASQRLTEGEIAIQQAFEELATSPLDNMLRLQRSLRSSIPSIEFYTPSVVLIGSPNVGKSSIVRTLSSAAPEVNNYPFTTRGMTLGHIPIYWKNQVKQKCQIMDSPGLLVREDNIRNEMELLTLASMQHLPTAVMYVMDLSGGAGDRCSSIQDQLKLRQEVRSRFPKRPWIDVVSKIDLGVQHGSLEALQEVLGDDPYLEISIHEKIGLQELNNEVLRMLGEVKVVLDAMADVSIED